MVNRYDYEGYPDEKGQSVLYADYEKLELQRDNLAWNLDGCMEAINRLSAELAGAKQQLALAPTYEKMIAHNGAQEARIAQLESALLSLLPGLVLDRRYADADDDIDALNSRIETVQEALHPTPPPSTLCAVCDQIKELHPSTHPWTAKTPPHLRGPVIQAFADSDGVPPGEAL